MNNITRAAFEAYQKAVVEYGVANDISFHEQKLWGEQGDRVRETSLVVDAAVKYLREARDTLDKAIRVEGLKDQ